MKYQQPFGISDPNASYINGDPSQARRGSIPPGMAIEGPQREVVGVISKSLLTPDDTDLLQLAKGVRSQALNYAVDSGATNTMVVALDPPLTAYTPGLPLRVKVLHTNTSVTVTLDAGGGTRPVVKMDGSTPAIGDLVAGGIIEVTYSGTVWQLTNFGGSGGGLGNVYQVNIPYVVDTGTVNHIVAAFSPAITTLGSGFICLVKIANTVTGPTDVTINAITAKAVKATDGGDLIPADLIAGDIAFMKYDGTQFYIDPDITILSNCTFNVPSTQFPTVDSVMRALKRKFIAPSATVTIQLSSGTFTPIYIYHPNADRIVLKGTMTTTAPAITDFSRTGNTPTIRAVDLITNLTMCRARYGTEIHFSTANIGQFSPGYQCGIINLGPGSPTIQDLLVTGDNIFAQYGAAAGVAGNFIIQNVAVCMSGAVGFNVNATFTGAPSFAFGNWTVGFDGNCNFRAPGHALSNASHGFLAGGAEILCTPAPVLSFSGPSHSECNGGNGMVADDRGTGFFFTAVSINNAGNDFWVGTLGFISVALATYNSIGNDGTGLIDTHRLDAGIANSWFF